MNMKKLFLLNLPYLLFVYPFDKLAQAFRLDVYKRQVIIFAKVITAQSFVQSCDFLVFSHNLRSFLRF